MIHAYFFQPGTACQAAPTLLFLNYTPGRDLKRLEDGYNCGDLGSIQGSICRIYHGSRTETSPSTSAFTCQSLFYQCSILICLRLRVAG
jgi:hypothetical protein